MTGKMTKKLLEKMRAAAIAAVVMELEKQKRAPGGGGGKAGRPGGRDAWKMAGRRERLGM